MNDPVNYVDLWGLSPSSETDTDISETRQKIADNALDQVGSTDWNTDAKKDNFDKGTNKCNKFVYDVTTEAGASPGLPNGNPIKKAIGLGSPPTAGQWGNPDYDIPGWRVLGEDEKPQPGDVAAQKIGDGQTSNATGHVAVVTGEGETTGTSGITNEITTTDFGFREGQEESVVFRRYGSKED